MAEARRQLSPTVGSFATMVQLRTLWRWEQGWRRSRYTVAVTEERGKGLLLYDNK